jgi:protein phosphatase
MYKLFKRSHVPGSFEVQMAGVCDTGIARDHNEDAIAIQEDDGRGFYLAIVCDGMGGHNAGELASALAVATIDEYLEENFERKKPEELLQEAFSLANSRIDEAASTNPDAEGMGCTCVVVVGVRERLWVAHAGDSRAYKVSRGDVRQLTIDHTMVQELVANGLITNEQAAVHPYRGRISRCLGHGKNKSDPEINEFFVEPGENILLCSDGLSDVVKNDDISSLVSMRDVRTACRRLVETANRAGGPDNISVVLMRRIV